MPPLLLALVNMVLEISIINNQSRDTTPVALSISQLLKFNCIKHKRTHDTSQSDIVRHSSTPVTPVPTYFGLVLHAHTRKRELVDGLYHLGMRISYDCVLRLSPQMGSSAYDQFYRDRVACPPKLRGNVFTTGAVDKIDHDPSSTTSKKYFHGTGISLLQHPTFIGKGVDRNIVIAVTSGDVGSKSVDYLPHFYSDVPHVINSIKK